jgi:osmotically-inducible protein OsmY
MLTRSDTCIRDDVLLELKWDPKISSDNDIAVAAKDGVVTLTGFVSSFWEKDAAERAAKRVDGVQGVAIDIEVKPFWEHTDPKIARDAVHELESHVSIRTDRIKVTAKNGLVVLERDVDSEYQKSLAKSAVKKLKGVTGVTNKIEVRPKDRIPRKPAHSTPPITSASTGTTPASSRSSRKPLSRKLSTSFQATATSKKAWASWL